METVKVKVKEIGGHTFEGKHYIQGDEIPNYPKEAYEENKGMFTLVTDSKSKTELKS